MNIKKKIIAIIRQTGLANAADKSRFYFKYCRYYFVNKLFAKSHPLFAFPPPYYLYETYALNYKDYYEDGLCTAREIIAFIEPFIDFNDSNISILDWGCGPGRIVRHLPALLPAQNKFFGCDYNARYIDWCNKNIDCVSFIKNDLKPPVSFVHNSFNWIYGLSILTHLSLNNHIAWIAEFSRILKPGALLLITTHGVQFNEKLTLSELDKFNNGDLVVRTTKTEGHRTYAAFQPEKFMRKLLSNFEIVKYIPGGSKENIVGTQDIWLVRKPLV